MLIRRSLIGCVVFASVGSAEVVSFSLDTSKARNPFQWTEIPVVEVKEKNEEEKVVLSAVAHVPWSLQGISRGNRGPYALLMNDKEVVVVSEQEDLGQGWKVEKIMSHCVRLKHDDGNYHELVL